MPPEIIYDESRVPEYTLPKALVLDNGSPVDSPASWKQQRRPELLKLFAQHVYGHTPSALPQLSYELVREDSQALQGKAHQKQIRIHCERLSVRHHIDVLIFLPAKQQAARVFLGLNFQGNHSVYADTTIARSRYASGDHGEKASRWQLDSLIDRGYGLVTLHCADLMPDREAAYNASVHRLFFDEGQTRPAADAWGAIGAWAWGLSRTLDYLETDPDINHQQVALIGHSRLGKTALWAAAQDERFALVIANNSGCGGAALSRRCFGETIASINDRFPHWFCSTFKRYNHHEADLPLDQHMLLALIAPRPLYIASAAEDLWADPKGEFLAAFHADTVYKLLETQGLPATKMPAINQASQGTIAYHIRSGKHDVTFFDWQHYLDFADRHLTG